MPDLSHIIGAILRDIAQARFAADVHSRDISRYYEQDALLRRFPIPRADIGEVEIALKFAIGTVSADPARLEGIETALGPILSRFSSGLASKFFDSLFAVLNPEQADQAIPTEGALPEPTRQRLHRAGSRIYLQQDLLLSLEQMREGMVWRGRLDDAALEGLRGVLAKTMAFLFEESELAPERLVGLREAVVGRMDLGAEFRALQEKIQAAQAAGERGGYRVDVHVDGATLQQTAESAISSLTLKVEMRNYLWSQVDERDGRVWRALSAE
jgi:hypothetical protein